MTATPEVRFGALAVADRGDVIALAGRILDATDEVEALSVPGPATMLVEVTESVRHQPFHLCEVVVSEASVAVRGHRGDGLVLGSDTERAVAVAVCDAAAAAGLFAADVERLVADTVAARARERRCRAATVAATRIDLEALG
jgi:alpha-D-ribose 1-methylphosphonate 5-triphosphate synthase subunit PhnG